MPSSVEYTKEMQDYLKVLKRTKATDPEAVKKARERLIRTGVADKDGHTKKEFGDRKPDIVDYMLWCLKFVTHSDVVEW